MTMTFGRVAYTLLVMWLCGGVPAIALALECRPSSLGEWLGAVGIVAFWPLCLLVFFFALLFGKEEV